MHAPVTRQPRRALTGGQALGTHEPQRFPAQWNSPFANWPWLERRPENLETLPMPNIGLIDGYADELTAIRRDLHAHPEIGFEEQRTSGIVAEKLESWGIEVHRGLGITGVVGVIRGRSDNGRRIGLRADMDALPMQEATNLPYRSTIPNRFHGCGHDGHTTMLLGTARYLAETRNFDGTAILIFQPAEEGVGGARAMLRDGLFQKFPCDELYALHNAPDLQPGQVTVLPGPAMAGADFFDITVKGYGSHGAMPHYAKDPVVIAMTLGQALQTIVSRNADPLEAAVVSITQFHAGSAYNVIPDDAKLAGTIRTFSDKIRNLARERMRAICAGIATSFGVEIDVDIRDIFTVLDNHKAQTDVVAEVAKEVVGADKVSLSPKPKMGSEDFADMLRAVPGSYFWLGHEGNVPVHNPGFIFDDKILPVGASLLARLVETRAARV
jgi:hippurate hydrolase